MCSFLKNGHFSPSRRGLARGVHSPSLTRTYGAFYREFAVWVCFHLSCHPHVFIPSFVAASGGSFLTYTGAGAAHSHSMSSSRFYTFVWCRKRGSAFYVHWSMCRAFVFHCHPRVFTLSFVAASGDLLFTYTGVCAAHSRRGFQP
jgi:hypothetical protein